MHLQSISLRIVSLLRSPDLVATVESVFAEACNLTTEEGVVFALVSDKVGNGPINAVLSHHQALALLQEGREVTGNGRWLNLGPGWRLSLAEAQEWNPYPDYERLGRWPSVVRGNADCLRRQLPLDAPPASLAATPATPTQGAFGSRPAVALVQSRAGELTDGLRRAFRQRNLDGVRGHARRLAGLGPGLTPAGDDWLAGWLVGLRALAELVGDSDLPLPVSRVGEAVVEGATGQTSALSLVFLQAAADGAVPQAWHSFLEALSCADLIPAQHAAEEIMRHGATSGSDMLAGFLTALQDE